VCVTAVDSRPPALGATVVAKRTPTQTLRAFVALTKPRIIELLLVTTVPTMILAAGGIPSLRLVSLTLLGGTLAAGSANALNCYLDRDIDVLMHRTARRPLPTASVTPREALVFGIALGVVAIVLMTLAVNVLAGALTLAAVLFYVFVYTVGLKRRTSSNIVWGGAAGCMPVLIGWSAVTGSLSWTPVVLFLVVFFWTPPHYWPLSLRFRDDYAAAGVPMLPVVAHPVTVTRRSLLYSMAMVATSLLLWPVAPTGLLYPIVAAGLGALFLLEAARLHGRARAGRVEPALRAMRLFHWSISYLALLFAAVAIDSLLFA
jgi:heme o synthase